MRVLFCGSGLFAVASLKGVLSAGHEVIGVITQPPRPAGRGGRLRPTPLATAARKVRLEAAQHEDINSSATLQWIRNRQPDVILVVDFGQIISNEVLRSAPLGALNLHASLLPELRGSAPVNWAIIRGYERTGVTTFSLTDRVDAGPVYLTDQTEIRPDETAVELRERLSEMGGSLVCKTLELLSSGPVEGSLQDESKATRAPRLKKSDGAIDFSSDAVSIRNLIHGTWDWPGGQAVFAPASGRRRIPVIIARASVGQGGGGGEPGALDDDLMVSTGRGRLRISEIKPAGRRLMEWQDFVNGYRPVKGDRFVTPGR